MKNLNTSLYVGCSLTQAPEDFKVRVESLKNALRTAGYEVFNFVGLVDGTPKDVYEKDICEYVRKADALLTICDYPSIGLGWEMAEAVKLGKPVLAFAHADTKVTRMIIGAAEVEPNFKFERYQHMEDDIVPFVCMLVPLKKHGKRFDNHKLKN